MSVDWMSALDLGRALRARAVSAEEVLDALIARYEVVNPRINAFALPLFDRAREAARRADRDLARGEGGPLCGIPVSVKDSQWLAGVPCKNGSKTLENFVPEATCAAIERLEEAGAVVFGKTTCPEFSYIGVTFSDVYGVTNNPWNLERTPGGSSGGAGAAVAAGLGPLSLGGDGGGSIRIPSAFCGLVGFKPTFGAVPREPCHPTWKSLAVYGPMARNVADARLMFRTVAGVDRRDRCSIGLPDAGSPLTSLRGLRVVASENLGHAPTDPDVLETYHAALGKLEAAGVEIVFDDPGLESSVEVWAITAMADAWVSERADYEQRPEELTAATLESLKFGSQFDLVQFQEAQYERERIHKAYADLYERSGADFLLKPTLGCEAFGHGRVWPERIGETAIELPWIDWAGFLYDANLAGFPACALPMGLGDEGLPLSLQIAGPRCSDYALLEAAFLMEEALEWPGRYPDLAEAPPETEARQTA
jgi:Asp-tRNA(Asn)/Glu-tRNA(Gln) amidotransferase A subunit family amidase